MARTRPQTRWNLSACFNLALVNMLVCCWSIWRPTPSSLQQNRKSKTNLKSIYSKVVLNISRHLCPAMWAIMAREDHSVKWMLMLWGPTFFLLFQSEDNTPVRKYLRYATSYNSAWQSGGSRALSFFHWPARAYGPMPSWTSRVAHLLQVTSLQETWFQVAQCDSMKREDLWPSSVPVSITKRR